MHRGLSPGGCPASLSLASAQGMEKQPDCLPFATCLIVPANDEIKVVHKLLESLILSKEALGTARDILLLLEVQVLHLPQNGDQLRDTQGLLVKPKMSHHSLRESRIYIQVGDRWRSPAPAPTSLLKFTLRTEELGSLRISGCSRLK